MIANRVVQSSYAIQRENIKYFYVVVRVCRGVYSPVPNTSTAVIIHNLASVFQTGLKMGYFEKKQQREIACR